MRLNVSGNVKAVPHAVLKASFVLLDSSFSLTVLLIGKAKDRTQKNWIRHRLPRGSAPFSEILKHGQKIDARRLNRALAAVQSKSLPDISPLFCRLNLRSATPLPGMQGLHSGMAVPHPRKLSCGPILSRCQIPTPSVYQRYKVP